MPNTPILGLPYPVDADTASVPRDVKALADAIDPLGVVPVGTILIWPTAVAPTSYLLLDGHQVLAADYPKLAAVLGSQGGQVTLPDLRNRFPIGAGDTPVGGAGGVATVALTQAQLPAHGHPSNFAVAPHGHPININSGVAGSHSHGLSNAGWWVMSTDRAAQDTWGSPTQATTQPYRQLISSDGSSPLIRIAAIAAAGDHQHAINGNSDAVALPISGSVNNTGGDQAHENRPPFLSVNFIIRAL